MIKPLRLIALALLLHIPLTSRADVKIADACRIRNRPPGRCGWCSLETLARHHHLAKLYGLTQSHASTCTSDALEQALVGTDVTYRIQYTGTYQQAILRYASEQQLGAVVGFRELHPGAGGHIVTLVDFNDDTVKVIDPNDKDGRTRTMSLEHFLYWWDGFALVLEPGLPEPATVVVAASLTSQPKTRPTTTSDRKGALPVK